MASEFKLAGSFFALVALGFLLWWFSLQQNPSSSDAGGGVDLKSPENWPTGDRVWDICRAIAQHEGYAVAGSVPLRLNNPGDLSPGDEHGSSTAGAPELHDGSMIIHFASPEDGWQALYSKIANIASGHSQVYSDSWSWLEVGGKYAEDPNWGSAVAHLLGVDPDSTPADYVNS